MDMEKINQKIKKIESRRNRIAENIKYLTGESKRLLKQMEDLENKLKTRLCSQFRDLLEKNQIPIQDVNLDEIVRVIKENQDAYTIKKKKKTSRAEDGQDVSAAIGFFSDEEKAASTSSSDSSSDSDDASDL